MSDEEQLDKILDNVFGYLEVGEAGIHGTDEEHRTALKRALLSWHQQEIERAVDEAKLEARKDTERLNFLQSLNDKKSYTGKAMLRMSTTGRGWRLHETEQEHAKQDVREAIDEFVELSKLQEEQ